MVLIQCTQKLLKELPKDQEDIVENFPSLLGNWHANLLQVERKRCLLFTNDATLYSFFVPKVTKQLLKNLASVLVINFNLNFTYEKLEKYRDKIMQRNKHITVTKSGSRSILGSMCNIDYLVRYFVKRHGGIEKVRLLELNSHINHIPFRFPSNDKHYYFPIELLQEKLGCEVKIS